MTATILILIYLFIVFPWVAYSLATAPKIEDDPELIYTTDDIRKIDVVDAEILTETKKL